MYKFLYFRKDTIWPSRKWNYNYTDYIDLSGKDFNMNYIEIFRKTLKFILTVPLVLIFIPILLISFPFFIIFSVLEWIFTGHFPSIFIDIFSDIQSLFKK